VGANTAYVGFTGGTGGLTAVQAILNWTYTVGNAPAVALKGAVTSGLSSNTQSGAKPLAVPQSTATSTTGPASTSLNSATQAAGLLQEVPGRRRSTLGG
jgi:hypothetical protein